MARGFDVEHIPPGAKLELYISPSCPYCRRAMAYYDAPARRMRSHDAQNDRGARERMFAYSGGDPTVPAIVVDGTIRAIGVGFAAARLNGPLDAPVGAVEMMRGGNGEGTATGKLLPEWRHHHG